MEAMKEFPDKFFDLAIVDPPYGGANSDIGGAKTLHFRTAKERQKLREQAVHGRANTQKNRGVGHSPGAGLFQ